LLGLFMACSAGAAEADTGRAGTPGKSAGERKGMRIGDFRMQTRTIYRIADGLPSDDVRCVAVDAQGNVYAGTDRGLARSSEGRWRPVDGLGECRIDALAAHGNGVIATASNAVHSVTAQAVTRLAGAALGKVNDIVGGKTVHVASDAGLFTLVGGELVRDEALHGLLADDKTVRRIAVGPKGELAAAARAGLFLKRPAGQWERLVPHEGARRWALRDVRGVSFDEHGRLWFAAAQGVGRRSDNWRLYTGAEGLPYDDFTAVACGRSGDVWFGTRIGAVHYDGRHWAYRQGLRWLPHDDVRDVDVGPDGSAWFATAGGVGVIRSVPMTLARKARFYESEIDKYHRRTKYGFVIEARTGKPGDKSECRRHDSDNDGLWTSMYGAGECFAYAVTKDPKARMRARQAWKALEFLGSVTQGGSHPAPAGFVARSILPTSGRNPNKTDTPQHDRRRRMDDKYWKIMDPRWPTSADGQWYWKCDTSSDELDGHYFFYGLYYDLVARTEADKAPVRERVRALTDHLIEHDFCLVDHDGKPTRWGVFRPSLLNGDPRWFAERGLNSLSTLSYLAVAEHVTGDRKYRQAADTLISRHGYAQNLLVPKIHTGPGTGNQSDDEMAFMGYYHLLKYEKDPKLREVYATSLARYWRMEAPEMNPLFNFIYAACFPRDDAGISRRTRRLFPADDEWLSDAIETLKRLPLDRFDWRHTNAYRKDIVPLPWRLNVIGEEARGKGYRVNGKVIPVDERFFNHWNHDPWRLNEGGDGANLGDGAVFLLPYYMGLYHGFVIESETDQRPSQ